MSAIKVFKEAVEVLKALSAAAASARSEVQQLLVVLEGPAVADVKPKIEPNSTATLSPGKGTDMVTLDKAALDALFEKETLVNSE